MKKSCHILSKILRGIGTVLAVLLSALGTLLCLSIKWMFDTWPHLSMDELVYTITAPLEGTNSDMIIEWANTSAVPAIIIFITMILLFVGFRRQNKIYYSVMALGIVVPLLASALSVKYTWDHLDVGTYMEDQGEYSTFIDDNYADPRDIEITFPEQKRNLIYIFLESMESTYADTDNGGAFEDNYIPELTALAQENEDFSGSGDDSGLLNGGSSLPGTTWTIGGMFAQTSGLPLNISIHGLDMDTQESFFGSTVTLGDILAQEGYNQRLMIGSDAAFAGRKLYFTEHGNYDIQDYYYAADNGLIPEDYYVWWGYEDEKLFDFAKDSLLELAGQEEPFNFTLLTVDTHFEDGYVCEACPDTYGDNQYANVIACSSSQVAEFVNWIQQQSFYENTTIVISGDHPTMDSDFCSEIDEDYTRKVYTAYINSAVDAQSSSRRDYTTFDAFPTTLASLGVTISGDRLGLGTNLFSTTPTLTELYGVDTVALQMNKKSKLMEELSDIQDTDALVAREGRLPSAAVTAGAYDYNTGEIPLIASDFQNIEQSDIQSMSAAVWTNEDQSDLQWVPLNLQEDGTCFGVIDVPNFDYKQGTYFINVYITDDNGESHLIGETTAYVE